MANIGNTQQQIDYGAAANDGTGDPLRTAFIKTDEKRTKNTIIFILKKTEF